MGLSAKVRLALKAAPDVDCRCPQATIQSLADLLAVTEEVLGVSFR